MIRLQQIKLKERVLLSSIQQPGWQLINLMLLFSLIFMQNIFHTSGECSDLAKVMESWFFSIHNLCQLHKLMSGPRLPTLANLLPPQRAPPTEPRTRRQLAETHPFQLSVTLPRKSNDTIFRSFPYRPITAWNSLPASVVRAAPASKDLQGFKTRAYNHLKKQNWLWATDALWSSTIDHETWITPVLNSVHPSTLLFF